MIPLTHATLPLAASPTGGTTPASAAARGPKDTGIVPAGGFADVFASMISTAAVPANSTPVPGIPGTGTDAMEAMEASTAKEASPETGQPGIVPAQATSLDAEPVEVNINAWLPSTPTTANAGEVMNERVRHPALSATTKAPAGELDPAAAAMPATSGEAVTGFADRLSGDPARGSVERAPLPVADAPLLTLQVPGDAKDPGAGSLPVATGPTAVIQLPDGGDSLPTAPTPGTAVPGTVLPVAGQPQVPTASAAPESASPISLVLGATAMETANDPVASVPPIPPGTVAEASNGDNAAVLPGTDGAPAIANTTAQPTPTAVGQSEPRAAAEILASARLSTDTGVAAVEPLEAPAAETPLVRTQAPSPLHRQLLGPIATLASGPHGERTLSVNIAPEALGPITVKAVLGGDGIRMELSAPTDAGREALRAILPELRRELAAGGSGTITLSTGSDSAATPGGHGGSQGTGGGDTRPFAPTAAPGLRTRDELAPEPQDQMTSTALHDTSHLDVMA